MILVCKSDEMMIRFRFELPTDQHVANQQSSQSIIDIQLNRSHHLAPQRPRVELLSFLFTN